MHLVPLVGLISAVALCLSGCSNSDSGFLEKEDTLGYEQHPGLDCNHGHGSDRVEYKLNDISMQQCLDACTREGPCDGVVIERHHHQIVTLQDQSNHTCWLHRRVDTNNCTASSDHDLWLRTAPAVAVTNSIVPVVVPFTVGLDEDCWKPCGEKYGYCAACSTPANPWSACCKRGATEGVCARAASDASEPRCVAVPFEQFPDGVPWMKNFQATFVHPDTQSNNQVSYSLDPMVCNQMEVDRASLQIRDAVALLSLGGVNIQCEQPVELSFIGVKIALKVIVSMKSAATLDAEFQLPATHRDVAEIKLASCKLNSELDIDFDFDSILLDWLTPALEWLADFTTSWLTEEVRKVACARGEDILEQEINPPLQKFAIDHHPKVLEDSVGLDCYTACGKEAGWCSACGPGRACCRAGHDSHLEECSAVQGMADTGRHECVEANSRPWLPSLVYRHDDLELNFLWGIGINLQKVTCGNVNITNVLMDITSSGFSSHITGLDFTIECTAEILMMGQTAYLHAVLQPGFHGMVDMHTPKDNPQCVPTNVADCRVNLPFKVTIAGHWGSWALNGLAEFLQWALQGTIQRTACQFVKEAAETTGQRILFDQIRPHYFNLGNPSPTPQSSPTPSPSSHSSPCPAPGSPGSPGGECVDTPGWNNGAGHDCSTYAGDWCKDGVFWGLGWAHNYPDRNCCACGKTSTAYTLALVSGGIIASLARPITALAFGILALHLH